MGDRDLHDHRSYALRVCERENENRRASVILHEENVSFQTEELCETIGYCR